MPDGGAITGPLLAGAGSAVVGGLLGGSSGGSSPAGSTTSTSTKDPWSGAQPYLLGSQTRQLKAGVQPIYKTVPTGVGGQIGILGGGYDENGAYIPGGFGGSGGVTQQVLSNPESDYQITGAPGVLPESQRLYQNQGWSPQMQSLSDTQGQTIANRTPGQVNQLNRFGLGLSGGLYDPNVSRVGGISGVAPINYSDIHASQVQGADLINAQSVNPESAFSAMGEANPLSSLSRMQSGQVNTSALDPVVSNALRRLSDNFNEQVIPSINQGAVAAGQYGGSRQGVAQGLAAKGLALAQGDTAANLYNGAFNTAQQNMYGTANNMAGLGLSNAQGNAARDLSAQATNAGNQLSAQQFNSDALNRISMANADNLLKSQMVNASNGLNTQQFNANLGLQNNSQAMANSQQQVANRLQGLNTMQAGNTLNDQAYQQQMGLLQQPNAYNWNNLNSFSSLVNNGAIQGGTTSSQNPYFSNTAGNILGGASMGLGMGSKLGWLLGSGSTPDYATGGGMWNPTSGFTD